MNIRERIKTKSTGFSHPLSHVHTHWLYLPFLEHSLAVPNALPKALAQWRPLSFHSSLASEASGWVASGGANYCQLWHCCVIPSKKRVVCWELDEHQHPTIYWKLVRKPPGGFHRVVLKYIQTFSPPKAKNHQWWAEKHRPTFPVVRWCSPKASGRIL